MDSKLCSVHFSLSSPASPLSTYLGSGASYLNLNELKLKIRFLRGTWVGQLVKHPALGFGAGRDLRVMGYSPASGPALSVEST